MPMVALPAVRVTEMLVPTAVRLPAASLRKPKLPLRVTKPAIVALRFVTTTAETPGRRLVRGALTVLFPTVTARVWLTVAALVLKATVAVPVTLLSPAMVSTVVPLAWRAKVLSVLKRRPMVPEVMPTLMVVPAVMVALMLLPATRIWVPLLLL